MHHTLTVGFLAVFFAVALRSGSAAIPPGDPYRRILELEQTRSLGKGELASYLASSDEGVATRAALAIGRTRLPAGAELLAQHLEDQRAPVRAMSIYGLGLIGQGTQVDAIAKALNDSSGAVRIAALDALGRYHTAHAIHDEDATVARAIVHTLDTDSDAAVRSRAAITLSYFANDGAVRALAEKHLAALFEKETDPTVRVHIMWSIFWSYSKVVPREFVAHALKDSDEYVRVEAVRAYARWHDTEAIATLKEFLHDPSWHVQEQTIIALNHLDGKPPIEHFTAIPSFVNVPKIPTDPYASVAALPRTRVQGEKPHKATIDDALFEPKILPQIAEDMIGPAPGPHPLVRIVTTKGNLYLMLYPEWAPMTVANFLAVADSGYYDSNRWFRIVPNFVVQTGDPSHDGDADLHYTIGAEENPLEQRPFVISMGMHYNEKGPERDSAGTQYYVTLSPQFHLNHDFTVFGSVISGSEVLAHLVESDRVLRVERLPDVTPNGGN